MGTEIRKVAKNWQHPKDKNGYYKPLYDETFEEALNKREEKRKKWIAGEDPDADQFNYPKTTQGFIEYYGNGPDPEFYRVEKWTEEESCCYQMYENVSEGTPLSPVFESLKDLEHWLVTSEGLSRQEAEDFCKSALLFKQKAIAAYEQLLRQ